MKLISKLFQPKKYTTSEPIKKELIYFMNWLQERGGNRALSNGPANIILDEYFEENDIAYVGEIRKIQGANTRNTTKELWTVIGAMLLGAATAIIVLIYVVKTSLI